jgi:hypothetical protein
MFQKMCDPLLANSANYHSLSKKAYMASKVMTKKNNNMDSSYISDISNSSPRVARRASVRQELNVPSALGLLGLEHLNNETTESTHREIVAGGQRDSMNNSMLPDDDPVKFL